MKSEFELWLEADVKAGFNREPVEGDEVRYVRPSYFGEVGRCLRGGLWVPMYQEVEEIKQRISNENNSPYASQRAGYILATLTGENVGEAAYLRSEVHAMMTNRVHPEFRWMRYVADATARMREDFNRRHELRQLNEYAKELMETKI